MTTIPSRPLPKYIPGAPGIEIPIPDTVPETWTPEPAEPERIPARV